MDLFKTYPMMVLVALALLTGQAVAHVISSPLEAVDIARIISGATCETKGRASFINGGYIYDGFWHNEGRYVVTNGKIIVTLDNGLERAFSISKTGDVLYMEQTALTCKR